MSRIEIITMSMREIDRPCRANHVGRTAVLRPRSLIVRSATQLFSARLRYCDNTQQSLTHL